MSSHTQNHPRQTEHYQIQVQGWLSERWATFNGMAVTINNRAADAPPIATLTGPVVDQAALRGVINKLWDLNLALVSVQRLENKGVRRTK
ncbi:hypothetical protein ACFLZW_00780 [Chloroflexota bacterium]